MRLANSAPTLGTPAAWATTALWPAAAGLAQAAAQLNPAATRSPRIHDPHAPEQQVGDRCPADMTP